MRSSNLRRIFLGALFWLGCFWLGCFPAFAVLALDGAAATNTTWSGSNSGAVTLTTTGSTGVIYLAIYAEAVGTPSATVSSVAATGLTFTSRTAIANNGAGSFGTSFNNLATYSAPYSSKQTSTVITVTLSKSIDDAVIIAFGIAGADTSTIWDATAPTTNTTVATSPFTVSGQSTSATNTILLMAAGNQNNNAKTAGNFGAAPATAIVSAVNNGGTNAAAMGVQYLVVSATQSSISDTMSGGANLWLVAADAIVAAGAAAPSSGYRSLLGVGR